MEALLSLSFDNLSSYDGGRIRKGLRQVEGLLAQICLSKDNNDKRRSFVSDPGKEPPNQRKLLSDLKDDPASREFFKLQEGFEWNVALRLVNCLDRLMGKSNDGQNDLLILANLDLIQGILLLHPPSRSLFSREIYMNVCQLKPSYYAAFLTDNSPALTRPPRASELSRNTICDPPDSGLCSYRNSAEHPNFRKARRAFNCYITL